MSNRRRYIDKSQTISFSENNFLSSEIFLNGGTLETLRIGRGWKHGDDLEVFHSFDGGSYKALCDSTGERVKIENVSADCDIVLTDLTSEGLLYLKFGRSSANASTVVIETIIKHK
jgi:hypothetical protein